MKDKKSKEDKKNPLKELDKIKLKGFKELEDQEFNEVNLDDFKKSRLEEFNEHELKDFKNYIEESKADRNIETLKLELKSDDTLKNTLKDLESIGIDGRGPLELLKKIKKGYI
jgi:hypothetical protein